MRAPPRSTDVASASAVSARQATNVTFMEATNAWGRAALGVASARPAK